MGGQSCLESGLVCRGRCGWVGGEGRRRVARCGWVGEGHEGPRHTAWRTSNGVENGVLCGLEPIACQSGTCSTGSFGGRGGGAGGMGGGGGEGTQSGPPQKQSGQE